VTDNLRAASRRAGSNVLLGRLALAEAPGALAGIADRLTVLFPWGSLLDAVAGRDPAGLARLRGTCRPGATVRFLFELASGQGPLPRLFADAGLDLHARPVAIEEARSLPTTWAKKLGYSGRPRAFWEFRGVARR
jgi:16S rRNA (adenine(1408)-N(1))-methyltransferase